MKKIFFLPIFLFACAKPTVYTTETVKITPPEILLQEVPIPALSAEAGQAVTNEDLLLYTLNLEQSLHLCNARLNSIKKSME